MTTNNTSHFGSRLITAAASQGLAAGSLLVDRAEASSAHRSADPEPPTVNTRTSGVNPAVVRQPSRAQTEAQTELGAY